MKVGFVGLGRMGAGMARRILDAGHELCVFDVFAKAAEPLAATEYAEIVAADSFESVTRLRGTCIALLAVRIGTTRLIDNMLIESSPDAPVHSYRCSL